MRKEIKGKQKINFMYFLSAILLGLKFTSIFCSENPKCPKGQHWDEEEEKCVKDEPEK